VNTDAGSKRGTYQVELAENQPNWIQLKDALARRLSPQVWATWINQIKCLEDNGKTLRIGLPDTFSLNWVKDHYRHVIEEELQSIGSIDLLFDLHEVGNDKEPEPSKASSPVEEALAIPEPVEEVRPTSFRSNIPTPSRPQLNPRYIFSNFVVGSSNELAWSAAQAIAENERPPYNPLVIVGGVGLGKTHLLHAIGHIFQKKRPQAKIQLKTSEAFINDVVTGIQEHRMPQVRSRYRNCDLLLIDDIQFISGKGHCQEEFFHTFNALYDAQKQIVVTSDRMPHEIADVEQRVRSRFAWGLIADLKLPELETRIAIIQQKAANEGLELDESVAKFLAQSVRSNTRELEGCINRVHAIATLRKTPITVNLTKEVLQGIISDKSQALTCDSIVRAVAAHFEIRISELKSTKRARNIAFPRQIAMYLCRNHTSASYPDIGNALGGKDHSTAINAVKKITEKITEPDVRNHIEEIERQLLD